MRLKRFYEGYDPDRTDDEAAEFKAALRKTSNRKVTHVNVLSHSEKWRPSTKVIKLGQAEGWLSLVDGKITLRTGPDDSDVVYNVVAPPGSYCCHCGEPFDAVALKAVGEDDVSVSEFVVAVQKKVTELAKSHVASEHDGKKSPSSNNPSGYAIHHFFMCELEAS